MAEHMLEIAYPISARAWRFLLIGSFITILFYAILIPLVDGCNVRYPIAATIAFIPTFFISVHVQRTWVFARDTTGKCNLHFTLMLVKYILLFLLSVTGVEHFSHTYGIWYLPLQIVSTLITALFISPIISWFIVRI